MFKRIGCLLLTAVLCLGIVAGCFVQTAHAEDTLTGANKRINTFLKLAQGKELMQEDVEGLTKDELRFLGIFISNFFVPFKTEIGEASKDENSYFYQSKEEICKALEENMAFSESSASNLVDTVLGLSRQSIVDTSELRFFLKKGNSYERLNGINVSYYAFREMMCYGGCKILRSYVAKLNDLGTVGTEIPVSMSDITSCDAVDGTHLEGCDFDRLYLGWEDTSGVHIIADSYLIENTSSMSSCQVAYALCMEVADVKNGYGTSLFNLTGYDIKSDDPNNISDEEFNNYMEKLRDGLSGAGGGSDYVNKSLAEGSIFGAKISVDCFGNIIMMGSNHQIVMVPACMNPYNYIAVDEKGNDRSVTVKNGISSKKFSAQDLKGEYIPIINAMVMELVDSGSIIKGGMSTYEDLADVTRARIHFNNLYEAFKDWNSDDYTRFKTKMWMGTKEDEYINEGKLDGGAASTIKNYILPYLDSLDDPFVSYMKSDMSLENSGFDFKKFRYVRTGFNFETLAKKSTEFQRYVLDKYCYTDTLGLNETQEFSAFNFFSYLSEDPGLMKDADKTGRNKSVSFESSFDNALKGKVWITKMDSITATSLYVTYAVASFYDDANKKDSIGQLGFRFDSSAFPKIPSDPLNLEFYQEPDRDTELESIKSWVYYLLHPTAGFNYVKILITNKLNHLLLGWHYDMTGTNGVGASVGTTAYKSNMGYVTLPDLSEIKWTSKLIDFYYSIIGFLALLIVVVMVLSAVSGAMRVQHAIIATVVFVVFLFVPVPLINGAVSLSNRISQGVYGEKFTYWALVQEESYGMAIDRAAEASNDGSGTYENYVKTVYNQNREVYSNQGGNAILVKWQAPKKFASVSLTEKNASVLNNASLQKILGKALNRAYGGQTYLDDKDATYMYRNYIDLSNYTRYVFNGIQKGYVDSVYSTGFGIDDAITSHWNDSTLASNAKSIVSQTDAYVNMGYTNKQGSIARYNVAYLGMPLSSRIINDTLTQKGTVSSLTLSDYVGINQDLFNMGVPMFSADNGYDITADNLIATGLITEESRVKAVKDAFITYGERDFSGLAAYALYSENPFYYFSWKLYTDGMSSNSHNNYGGYKSLILDKPNGGYFYNNGYNGEMKDFMDMRGLFTYIIPYMKQCNDIVHEWDDVYGLFIYDGVPVEEGHQADVQDNPELNRKYWHNLNVARLYGIYCPWVDLMYDCGYAKSETIKVLGESVVIEDPINPASYPENRPMIFSRSEMVDYGLSDSDLTKVEKRILECNDGFQERLFELLNYYNFSDVSLNTAAAMNCAFEFNKTFSETSLLGRSRDIYPQSFDLADFSYDAFLRLILANNTGEDLLSRSRLSASSVTGEDTGDFYERLVNKSSTFTVIIMILLDILSQYVIPGLRILFLFAIFLGSIFMVLAHLMKVKPNMKFYRDLFINLVTPMLSFFLITVGFSLLISLFVGVGNNSVTQTNDTTIQLGDPALTMIIMCVLNIVCMVLYWKVLSNVFKELKKNFQSVTAFAGGVIVGSGAAVAGAVSGGLLARAGANASGDGGYSGSTGSTGGSGDSQSRGRTSSRAESRAAGNRVTVGELIERRDEHSQGKQARRENREAKKEARYEKKSGSLDRKIESNEKKTKKLNDRIASGSGKISERDKNRQAKLKDRNKALKEKRAKLNKKKPKSSKK